MYSLTGGHSSTKRCVVVVVEELKVAAEDYILYP